MADQGPDLVTKLIKVLVEERTTLREDKQKVEQANKKLQLQLLQHQAQMGQLREELAAMTRDNRRLSTLNNLLQSQVEHLSTQLAEATVRLPHSHLPHIQSKKQPQLVPWDFLMENHEIIIQALGPTLDGMLNKMALEFQDSLMDLVGRISKQQERESQSQQGLNVFARSVLSREAGNRASNPDSLMHSRSSLGRSQETMGAILPESMPFMDSDSSLSPRESSQMRAMYSEGITLADNGPRLPTKSLSEASNMLGEAAGRLAPKPGPRMPLEEIAAPNGPYRPSDNPNTVDHPIKRTLSPFSPTSPSCSSVPESSTFMLSHELSSNTAPIHDSHFSTFTDSYSTGLSPGLSSNTGPIHDSSFSTYTDSYSNCLSPSKSSSTSYSSSSSRASSRRTLSPIVTSSSSPTESFASSGSLGSLPNQESPPGPSFQPGDTMASPEVNSIFTSPDSQQSGQSMSKMFVTWSDLRPAAQILQKLSADGRILATGTPPKPWAPREEMGMSPVPSSGSPAASIATSIMGHNLSELGFSYMHGGSASVVSEENSTIKAPRSVFSEGDYNDERPEIQLPKDPSLTKLRRKKLIRKLWSR